MQEHADGYIPKRGRSGSYQTTSVTCSLPRDVEKQLKEESEDLGVSRSELMRRAVLMYVELLSYQRNARERMRGGDTLLEVLGGEGDVDET